MRKLASEMRDSSKDFSFALLFFLLLFFKQDEFSVVNEIAKRIFFFFFLASGKNNSLWKWTVEEQQCTEQVQGALRGKTTTISLPFVFFQSVPMALSV